MYDTILRVVVTTTPRVIIYTGNKTDAQVNMYKILVQIGAIKAN